MLNGGFFDTLLEARALTERWRKEYIGYRPQISWGYRLPSPEACEANKIAIIDVGKSKNLSSEEGTVMGTAYKFSEKVNRIIRLIRDGKVEKAIDLIEVDDIKDMHTWAIYYAMDEKYIEAKKILKKESELKPEKAVSTRIIDIIENINQGKINHGLRRSDNTELLDLFELAGLYIVEKKYDIAQKIAERIIKIDEKIPDGWTLRGNALRMMQQYEEAINNYDEAVVIIPTDSFLWSNKAIIYEEIGDYEKGLESCSRAIELDSTNISAWKRKGTFLVKLRRYHEAKECLDKVIEFEPNDPDAWYESGILRSEMGEFEESISFFNEVLKLRPDYHMAIASIGTSLSELAQFDKAIECYDSAIKIKPGEKRLWYNQGNILLKYGKYKEALKCFEKAIELSPDYATSWGGKGICLSQLGKYREALDCYEKGISLDPEIPQFWVNKAGVHIELKEYHAALKSMEIALVLNPQDTYAWLNKGIIYDKLDRQAESIECIHKAIELSPHNAEVWRSKGDFHQNNREYKEAIDSYNKAIGYNSTDDDAIYSKGFAHFSLNQEEEALQCFNRSIELNSEKVGAFLGRGIIHLNRRCYKESLDDLIKSRGLFQQLKSIDLLTGIDRIIQTAKNAINLIDCLTPLDQEFLNSLQSKSLADFKSKIIELSTKIEAVAKEFRPLILPEDTIELVECKMFCFQAFADLFSKGERNADKLNKTRATFEKWSLDSYLVAIDSIDSLFRVLKKYDSIDAIPPEDEKTIFASILGPAIMVDGELTQDITDRIKETPVYISRTERARQIRVQEIFIEGKGSVRLKVAIVQFNLSLERRHNPFGYLIPSQNEQEIKTKIFNAINISRDQNADIVCFPELSFKKEWVEEIKGDCENIVICGSYYDDDAYNVCPIIIKGEIWNYKKCHYSIYEEPNGEGMIRGDILYIFQTRFGKISVLNCIDFNKEYSKILDTSVDVIINPRCDADAKYGFQKLSNFQIDQANGSKLPTFFIHINPSHIKLHNKEGGGGTSIICCEHKDRLLKYRDDGICPADDIEYKVFEAKDEMIYIASLNLDANFLAKRVKIESLYTLRDTEWEPITNRRIWL